MNAMKDESIVEALSDAGCSSEEIRAISQCCREGKTGKAQKLIEKCRRRKLDDPHDQQRRIDCLDYLSYQLQKG